MRPAKRSLCGALLALVLVASLVPLAGPAGAVGTFGDDDGNVHESNIEKIAGCGPGNAGVRQAQFHVDDRNRTGAPYRVEDFSKFDLEGTAPNGNAYPFDTFKLKNGTHYVTAAMILAEGHTETHTAAFDVANAPSVWTDLQNVGFNVPPNLSQSGNKSVEIDSNTGKPIAWKATTNRSWLTLDNSSGSGGQDLAFHVSSSGLTPGIRTATVTVEATGYQTRAFTVTMHILATGECPSPLGTDVRVALPFFLNFTTAVEGTVGASNGAGTGFTCVQATSRGEGYLPSELILDPSSGNLSLSTTSGIADESADAQDNALGVGFDGSGVTRISTTLMSPPWEGDGGFEQAGVWVGIHEDTYVKAVLVDTPAGNAVQLRSESLGVAQGTQQLVLPPAAPRTIELILTIDDTTNRATLGYSLDGAPTKTLAGTVVVSQGVFDGIDPDGSGPSGTDSLAGIFGTHRNGTPKTYVFGNFSVRKP